MNIKKIYHYHLPKCAGTTINTWLDGFFHYDRCRPPNFNINFPSSFSEKKFLEEFLKVKKIYEKKQSIELKTKTLTTAKIHYSWNNFDVLHGHNSLLSNLQPNTFVFTILRDPIARCRSQFRDHKRLTYSDVAHLKPSAQEVRLACQSLKLDDFLAKYQGQFNFMKLYNDAQCRLLTQDIIPSIRFFKLSEEERFNAALEVLNHKFDFFGTQENLLKSLEIISHKVGFPPPRKLNTKNKTSSKEKADDLLAKDSTNEGFLKNNRADIYLHREITDRLLKKISVIPEYTREQFELNGLKLALSRLKPNSVGRQSIFDMNMPLIGDGYLERDAPGTSNCARWSTGDGLSYFYLPVKSNSKIRVLIYLKGWLDWSDSKFLEVFADDQRIKFTRNLPPKGGECIELVILTNSYGWLRIETRTPETKTSKERGIEDDDPRQRGYLLWKYSTEEI